jgi:hypothetical protein
MTTECRAIRDRKALTAQIRIAAIPHVGLEDIIDEPGTEEALLHAMSVLQGIVNEYQDGGDQMVETCDCGRHVPDQEVTMTIPFQLTTVDLKLEPGARDTDLKEQLEHMIQFLDEAEFPRVLKAAVILHSAGAGTMGECLYTAVIWERG